MVKVCVCVCECVLDPAQRVPHGDGLPQRGQHLVPVGDPHAAGLGADDHMAQVFAPSVVCGLRHGDPQGELLPAERHGYINRLCRRDSACFCPKLHETGQKKNKVLCWFYWERSFWVEKVKSVECSDSYYTQTEKLYRTGSQFSQKNKITKTIQLVWFSRQPFFWKLSFFYFSHFPMSQTQTEAEHSCEK